MFLFNMNNFQQHYFAERGILCKIKTASRATITAAIHIPAYHEHANNFINQKKMVTPRIIEILLNREIVC